MQNYELTIVLPGKTTAAKKKAMVEKVETMVKAFKGKIEKTDDWGEKELAYNIKKSETGNFTHFKLQLTPKDAKSLGDKIRLEEELLRYLLVRA